MAYLLSTFLGFLLINKFVCSFQNFLSMSSKLKHDNFSSNVINMGEHHHRPGNQLSSNTNSVAFTFDETTKFRVIAVYVKARRCDRHADDRFFLLALAHWINSQNRWHCQPSQLSTISRPQLAKHLSRFRLQPLKVSVISSACAQHFCRAFKFDFSFDVSRIA